MQTVQTLDLLYSLKCTKNYCFTVHNGFHVRIRLANDIGSVFDSVFTAGACRSENKTVQYLAESKNLTIDEYEELIERPIKGLDYKASGDHLLEAIEKSFSDIDFALEGGESTRKAQERAIPVIHKLINDYYGKTIVIGTHGNIMTIIMNYYNKNYGYHFWNSTSKPDIYKLIFVQDQLQDIERIWESFSDGQ